MESKTEDKGSVHFENAQDPTRQPSNEDGFGGEKAEYAPEGIAQDTQILASPEEQARVRKYMWKLDCIILPTISALYFFEYLGMYPPTILLSH